MNPSVTFRHPNLPDLKSNILVDSNGHACLAGPSLLTMPSDELSDISPIEKGGTVRGMSPELLDPTRFGLQEGRPTKASDCYALGMVIYEVLSGQRPFTADNNLDVMVKTMRGERPRRPQGKEGKRFTNSIWDTLNLCWKQKPRDRIDASAVLLRLEKHPPLPMPSSSVGGGGRDASDCTFLVFHPRLIIYFPCAV